MRARAVLSLLIFFAFAAGDALAQEQAEGSEAGAEAAPEATEEESDPAVSLAEAQRLYDALEYDQVVPLAEAVLAHPRATVEQRLDAYLLQGSSLAVIGDQIEAEKPFRFLLRGRPDFDMPAETPPKILQVFRKVQVEERAIVEQMRELERKRTIASLVLEGAPLEGLTGGLPIAFDYRLEDPRGAVTRVEVRYRRQGDAQYSALPLERTSGRWVGQIPGEWSENEDGFVFEYHVATWGMGEQPLLVEGSADKPLRADVAPGEVGDAVPFYQSYWFWGVTGAAVTAVTVAASGSAGALLYVGSLPPTSDLPTTYVP